MAAGEIVEFIDKIAVTAADQHVSEKNEQANAANQAPVARQFSAGGNLAIHRRMLPEKLEMILHLEEAF